MPGDRRRVLGAAGEAFVARWYEDRGYSVVDRNWRCRAGEIDLVVERAGELVFCEVKTRAGDAFGAPFEAVTVTKQRRLRGLAAQWLGAHTGGFAASLRFDVASVRKRPGRAPEVDVITGAF